MTEPTKKIQRTFQGEVVSDKGDKTIIVRVDRTILHPKYQKRERKSSRFAVHDEANAFHVGDRVRFVECRPLSKIKRWRVIEKIT